MNLPTQAELDELCSGRAERAGPTGLTTDLWKKLHTIAVPARACTPTQRVKAEWVHEYLTTPDKRTFSGDPFGHIVVDNGRWLIEDGHHRWAASVFAGNTYWIARVFVR